MKSGDIGVACGVCAVVSTVCDLFYLFVCLLINLLIFSFLLFIVYMINVLLCFVVIQNILEGVWCDDGDNKNNNNNNNSCGCFLVRLFLFINAIIF
jgi:hypothetical protein